MDVENIAQFVSDAGVDEFSRVRQEVVCRADLRMADVVDHGGYLSRRSGVANEV